MEVKIGDVCIPGDRLVGLEEYSNGYGTHTRHGYIFASMTGQVQVAENKVGKPSVFVRPKRKAQAIPKVASTVICEITKLTSTFARCQIIKIEKEQLNDPLRGLIRKEDVRSIDRDKVEMHKCFRPGDLAVAKVLSLGDTSCYLLSTA